MVGDKFVPLTIQTSVQFRDFGELHLRSFSTNRFSNLATLLSSCVDGFFLLTVPCKKLKNRGRIYLKEVTYINCTFLRNFFQINTVSVQLLTYINRVCEVYHYISHLVLLKCKAFSTHYISILSFLKELHSGKKVVVTLAKTALLSTNSFIYYSILFKRRNTPPPPSPFPLPHINAVCSK